MSTDSDAASLAGVEEEDDDVARTERTSDWATEVSASALSSQFRVTSRSSMFRRSPRAPPLRDLYEIPDVAPPPPRPPPVVEPEEVLPIPSVVELDEPQPTLEETPLIPDGVTEGWETIDDETRASTIHPHESLPPYEEEYEPEPALEEPEEKPLPPPPKVDTKKNLKRALSLRGKMTILQKRIKAAESERTQAKANNKSALALRKKMEIQELKAEMEKLRKKDTETTFSMHNEGGISDRIDLSQLDDEAAVEEVEKAIEYFITQSFPPDAPGSSTGADAQTLYATVDSESKKQAVIQAMNEHGIQVDSNDLTNVLIIPLPRA